MRSSHDCRCGRHSHSSRVLTKQWRMAGGTERRKNKENSSSMVVIETWKNIGEEGQILLGNCYRQTWMKNTILEEHLGACYHHTYIAGFHAILSHFFV